MVVTLEEMKNYLRVDFEDDDALLSGIIAQSQQLCGILRDFLRKSLKNSR